MEDTEPAKNDPVGEGTLDVIARADKFTRWMYRTIKPFCNGRIFEIGSGTGNISRYFIEDHQQIMLSDFREAYCYNLSATFGKNPSVLGIELMDLIDPGFDNKFARHMGKFDTVFALNVVEHISNDALALNNCYKLLAKGGHVVILVPSYQKLYNSLDRELGHFRRYTKSSLSLVFSLTEFQIIHKQYFNFTGIFGWYFSGTILKKKIIPGNQMRIYNFLLPAIKIIDKAVLNQAGLSTIIIGRK